MKLYVFLSIIISFSSGLSKVLNKVVIMRKSKEAS